MTGLYLVFNSLKIFNILIDFSLAMLNYGHLKKAICFEIKEIKIICFYLNNISCFYVLFEQKLSTY